MDTQTKTGKVYLQPHKAGKKWKPVWLSLFPQSSNGGHVEIKDVGGGGAGDDHGAVIRRHHHPHVERKPKVVQLSDIINVLRLPPNAEACPMENMSAFCMETKERTMVFATLKDDCVDWVEKLCHSIAQRGGSSGSNKLHMEENQIYASADEATEFLVMVQKTDAATRCGLQGYYWLQVGRETLVLRETQKKNIVREWPYEFLRRYGRDKVALTIEAGRRCDSGPGSFNFETQQAEKIFFLIQSTIKWKTSSVTLGHQNQEGGKGTPTNIPAHSSLPKMLDATCKAAISEESAHVQEDSIGSSGCVSAQPAPITLMPLPLVPTHDSQSGSHLGGQSEAVYADPTYCIKSKPNPQPTTALYIDPASVLPLKPPCSGPTVTSDPNPSALNSSFNMDHPDSVYSEVYDKISPVHSKQIHTQPKGERRFADDEPIYTEPISKKDEMSDQNDRKPDPFSYLYAQVCKTKPSSSPSPSSDTIPSCSASSSSTAATTSTTDTKDQSLDDVIYENLGFV